MAPRSMGAPRGLLASSADGREGVRVWTQSYWLGSLGIERRALWDKSLEVGPPALALAQISLPEVT